MEWFAPHRRNFATMYRSIWWILISLEEKQDKTPEEKAKLVDCKAQLDILWAKMSDAQKHDTDPTFELRQEHGGKWVKVRTIVCPNCGWMHHIREGSSGPPRCHVCMMDVDIT